MGKSIYFFRLVHKKILPSIGKSAIPAIYKIKSDGSLTAVNIKTIPHSLTSVFLKTTAPKFSIP